MKSAKPVLIDADVLCYRIAAACAANNDDPADVYDYVRGERQKWLDGLAAWLGDDDFKVFHVFSGPGDRWRNWVFEPYKANRKEEDKPEYLEVARNSIREFEGVTVLETPHLEADDVISIWCTHSHNVKRQPYIVSVDKDFLTVYGAQLYDPSKDVLFERNTAASAFRNLAKQWLTGDRVDNYKGIPGVGEKKAEKLLDEVDWASMDVGRLLHWMQEVYAEKKQSENYCRLQGAMANLIHFDQVIIGKGGKIEGFRPWPCLGTVRIKGDIGYHEG